MYNQNSANIITQPNKKSDSCKNKIKKRIVIWNKENKICTHTMYTGKLKLIKRQPSFETKMYLIGKLKLGQINILQNTKLNTEYMDRIWAMILNQTFRI